MMFIQTGKIQCDNKNKHNPNLAHVMSRVNRSDVPSGAMRGLRAFDHVPRTQMQIVVAVKNTITPFE